MLAVDRPKMRFYKWSFFDQKRSEVITTRYSESTIYSIAYQQYNNAFLRMMVLSPDICPCLSQRQIDQFIKQTIRMIGPDCGAVFNYSLSQYFFILFAGELQCQITLN